MENLLLFPPNQPNKIDIKNPTKVQTSKLYYINYIIFLHNRHEKLTLIITFMFSTHFIVGFWLMYAVAADFSMKAEFNQKKLLSFFQINIYAIQLSFQLLKNHQFFSKLEET